MVKTSRHRRKQVLALLAKHGPMSMHAIAQVLEPKIERRRLYEVIQRMKSSGLIEGCAFGALGGAHLFYRLPASIKGLENVANVLSIPVSSLRQPHFRRVELFHSDSCALWAEYFERSLPGLKVLREHHYFGNKGLVGVLANSNDERETTPDMVLQLESKMGVPVSVAVEIERSIKSKERLAKKLINYAEESRLDGVIYLCEGNATSDRIRQVYNSQVLQKASRIGQYGKHFAIFSDTAFCGFSRTPAMLNAACGPVDWKTWLLHLASNENACRRDAEFSIPAIIAWNQNARRNERKQGETLKRTNN